MATTCLGSCAAVTLPVLPTCRDIGRSANVRKIMIVPCDAAFDYSKLDPTTNSPTLIAQAVATLFPAVGSAGAYVLATGDTDSFPEVAFTERKVGAGAVLRTPNEMEWKFRNSYFWESAQPVTSPQTAIYGEQEAAEFVNQIQSNTAFIAYVDDNDQFYILQRPPYAGREFELAHAAPYGSLTQTGDLDARTDMWNFSVKFPQGFTRTQPLFNVGVATVLNPTLEVLSGR